MKTANPNMFIFDSEESARRFFKKQKAGSELLKGLKIGAGNWFVDNTPVNSPSEETARQAWPSHYELVETRNNLSSPNGRVLHIARIRERIICRQEDETLVLDLSSQDKDMMAGGGLDPNKDEDVFTFINHIQPHRPFASYRNAGGSPPEGWPDEDELIREWAKNEGIDGSI